MSINNAVTELYSKTNMIMSHFSHSDAVVRYELLKTYCMPLYGCTLWNLTSSHMDRFYTAWSWWGGGVGGAKRWVLEV